MAFSDWIWSPVHQDYYMWECDANGNPVYRWAKQTQAATTSQPSPPGPATTPWPVDRRDSVLYTNHASPQPAALPQTEYIAGTSGHRERLDSSYFVREGSECQRFFKKGRVFAMLWSEPAGSTAPNNGLNYAFSVVRFGESVYTNIRRFVVVHVPNGKGFVYACGIFTYSNRGVLKEGCTPEDHAAVYFEGTDPTVLTAEFQAGMTNESIEIDPSEGNSSLHWASRINFGKTVAIEKNVKVKEIGRVSPAHLSNLTACWKVAKGEEDDD